jgi:hypothetical protein
MHHTIEYIQQKEAFKKTVKTTPPAKNGKNTSLENLWYRLRC